jgi:3-phosphoshikimate 1-carboxyvinyltransferase
MLAAFGHPVRREGNAITVAPGGLRGTDIAVPADLSSAAFFMVGACIAPGSDVTLAAVGMNPTRAGVVDILKRMGADIAIVNPRMLGGEPTADLRVRHARLHGIAIPEELVPLAIDEFPALFIAAANAEGETTLTGAAELRVKESDRIQVMADGLAALGIEATPTADGIRIRGGARAEGGACTGGTVASHGDHRIAMAFAMAGLRAQAEIIVEDSANVATSFPGFVELARAAGLGIRAE